MKKNWYSFIICCLVAMLSACQNEDELSNSNVGYLRLTMGVDMSVNTRANGEEVYDPKQIAVQIVSENDEIVEETSNWEEWSGKQITLPVGKYTVKASSAGFDGATSGFDKPYYAGSAEITIQKDTEVNQTVTCTLANVKVTVNFDQTFVDNFTSANVEVDDNADNAGISPLTFTMGEATQSGYFPVTDLKAVVTAVNKNNVSNTQTDVIENVKARDHYILNYKVDDGKGDGSVSIEFDNTLKTYIYTFFIPTKPTTELNVTASAWAKLAYLTGNVVTSKEELTPENMKFQYRVKDAADWTDAVATLNGETYEGKVLGLTPETTYEYRMVYGEEQFVTEVQEFTTEAAIALHNGSFEDWNKGTGNYKNTWFADVAGSADFNKSFWDSGNIGTSTGMAALLGAKNPTSPEETIVHSSGKSAKLASTYVVIQFAAGNIYTGNYQETIMDPMGARINFGQPFTARPMALHGWIQYTPGEVNRGEDENLPSDATLHLGDTDQNAVYIALSDKGAPYEVNNGAKQFIDFDNDPNIIAYGELPQEECVATDGWKEVNIPLVYRSLDRKPTHIIIVMSASKYGDYFVGSDSSVMYVDDFELIYDGEPSVQE